MTEKYNVIDLFAGCGGLTEGFFNEGFNVLSHIEIDKYACQTLSQRIKFYGYDDYEESVINDDITQPSTLKKLKDSVGNKNIDVIIGGPPCQSYSSLGKARDKDGMRNDPRNYLFESYVDILSIYKPKIFVFENVLGILNSKVNDVYIIDKIMKELSKEYNLIGDPKEMILNASNYGVPQERKRLIIIGVRKDLSITPKDVYNNIIKKNYSLEDEKLGLNSHLPKYITVRDAIGDLPKLLPGEGKKSMNYLPTYKNSFLEYVNDILQNAIEDHIARNHNVIDQERYRYMAKNEWSFKTLLEQKPELNHPNPRVFGNSYVVQMWDKPSRTIISHLYKDGNQFIHPDYKQSRTLTAREAARLQSFPDNFHFPLSRTQQYKQIGNAVPPLLSIQIAKSIKSILEKEKENDIQKRKILR